MECVVTRNTQTTGPTTGILTVDGTFFCYTLEPNEQRTTYPAIPCGRYKVIITYSTRFHRLLPLVVGVPGRLGIRIHPGNDEGDTEGCILLGFARVANDVQQSRPACEQFQRMIEAPLHAQQPVWFTIQEQEKLA